MSKFCRMGDALDFEKQRIILLIVHRGLYNFDIDNLSKKERV